jgi:hypothetical protein
MRRVFRYPPVGLSRKCFPTFITTSFTIATRLIWPARVKITLEISQTRRPRSNLTLVFRRRHSSHFIQPFEPNLLFPFTEILLLALKRMSVIPFPVTPAAVPCSTGKTRRSWHIRIALLDYTRKRGRKVLKCRSIDSDLERKGVEGLLLVDLILVIKRLLEKSWGILVLGKGVVLCCGQLCPLFPCVIVSLRFRNTFGNEFCYLFTILDRYSVQLVRE